MTDKTGAIVGGLTKEDFKITEDNRPQNIAVFERQSEMPLNLTLAIDTSSSTYKDRAIEQQAAKKFVHALLRTQDQMSVIEFDTFVSELTGFTNKVALIDHGLDHMRGEGGTALYDAIYLGSKALGNKDGRKVLVLVTDGGDTVKSSTYDEAIEQALRNEVMIYSIIDVPIEASAGRDIGGEHALIQLSEDTGGKHFYVDAGGLDKAFAKRQRRPPHAIHNRLLPRASRSQEKHSITIDVTVPRAATESFNIRHKTGYYAEPQKNRD